MAKPTDDPDPMTETTRKMRRMLLVVASLLLLLRAVPEMEPKAIPALGVEFATAGQSGGPVIGAMLLIGAYLLVAFVWYALRDFRFRDNTSIIQIISSALSKVSIVGQCMGPFGGGWDWDHSLSLIGALAELRNHVGMGRPNFAALVARVCLSRSYELLTHKVTVFWLLDFWFPVALALLALWGNGGPAIDLIYRVGASF